MAEYTTPGVYIAETGGPPPPIAALDAAVAGFVGIAEPVPGAVPPAHGITAAAEFGRYWSTAPVLADGTANVLWAAVRGFYANGGDRLHVAAVPPDGDPAAPVAGLADTDAALIAAPDVQALRPAAAGATMEALVALAAVPLSNRMALLDAPAGLSIAALRDWRRRFDTPAAALYWPWLRTTGGTMLPPSAIVAGAIARTDSERGVWKAPANIALMDVTAASVVTTREQELLNPVGINAIRTFTGKGPLVWGARTLSSDPDWKYIPVRRFAAMLAASITRGLAWVVFEPNGPVLWARVREAADTFLTDLWRQGALAGDRPDAAFFVRCDTTTMTAADIANGRLVIRIGHAPLRPAEFIITHLALATAT
ncbi:phage tail sheath family protein [Sandarakinorhabdus sp. DWP1-3-1]|uniref:phage tail sheath family protein n=1 Tax=Sandarakinorhabdus sp. DWP1-3-1 TaxID=2804627 RepID=UPI003CE9CE92